METTKTEMKEITMDASMVNTKALIFVPIILFIFAVPYFLLWPNGHSGGLFDILFNNIFFTLFIIFIGVILHELIHGLFWSFYLKKGFRAIRFGIMWTHLTPYCHSKEPMKLKHYRIGGIMPAILLGFIPAVISLFTGSLGILVFGIFFSIAAGGDLLMIWMMRNENRNDWVQDHPDKIGCFISKDLDHLAK